MRSPASILLSLALAGCSGVSGDVLAALDSGADSAPPADAAADGAHPHPDGGVPVAMILHPASGSMYAAGAQVPFVGDATDPQDGTLAGGALVWTTDLAPQTPIGTGASFSAALPTGAQTITLTATDSLGLTGTATVMVTVQ
jgi:hypothetical protein